MDPSEREAWREADRILGELLDGPDRERGARLAVHVAGHVREFLGPVRMMVIDGRRGHARAIDRRAAGHLDRRRIGHPHIRRVRPMHMFDLF